MIVNMLDVKEWSEPSDLRGVARKKKAIVTCNMFALAGVAS